MEDLTRKIEMAAREYCDCYSHHFFWQEVNIITFKNGALSSEAKDYWQQNTYSEEEVRKLLNQCNTLSQCENDFNEQEWFETNKKK